MRKPNILRRVRFLFGCSQKLDLQGTNVIAKNRTNRGGIYIYPCSVLVVRLLWCSVFLWPIGEKTQGCKLAVKGHALGAIQFLVPPSRSTLSFAKVGTPLGLVLRERERENAIISYENHALPTHLPLQ